jgi:acyl carrier protein
MSGWMECCIQLADQETRMGLDGMELVMEVEDRFGIKVEDWEAERVRTVGDLVLLVRRKLQFREDRCLTSHVFYRLRRAVESCGTQGRRDSRVSPGSTIAEVLRLETRHLDWQRLRAGSSLALPELERSRKLTATVWWSSFWVGAAVALILLPRGVCVMAGGGVLASVLSACLGFWLTRPRMRHLPAIHTMGELTRDVLARNFGEVAKKVSSLREREMRDAVYATVAEALGVRSTELRDDTRFIEDLNMG